MSGEATGFIVGTALALALLPVVAGAAAVVGVGYGAVKVGQAIVKANQRKKEKQAIEQKKRQERLNQLDIKEQREITQLFSKLDQLQMNEQATQTRLNEQLATSYQNFAHSLSEQNLNNNINIESIKKSSDDHLSQLIKKWKLDSQTLEADFSKKLNGIVNQMKNTIQSQKEENEKFFSSVNAQEERQKGLARDQIGQAELYIKALYVDSLKPSKTILDSYEQCIDYYNRKLFSNAYALASNISLQALTELEEKEIDRIQISQLQDEVKIEIALIQGRLEVLKNYSSTIDGKTYQKDLTQTDPILFKNLEKTLKEMEKEVESSTSIYELRQISREIEELKNDATSLIHYSLRLFLNTIVENNEARKITMIMKNQGYRLSGYSYLKETDGEPLHLNYENPISKEKLTVVLIPEDSGIKISIHNYGTGQNVADPIKQQALTSIISRALNIPINCEQLGRNSTQHSQSDLEQVKLGGVQSK